jgi:hypothetical protein
MLTAENQKTEELRQLKEKIANRQQGIEPEIVNDETVNPEIETNPETETELTKEQKAIQKMQKRIDEEVRKRKELEEKIAKQTPQEKDDVETLLEEIKSEGLKYQAEKKDLKKKWRAAVQDGDDDLADKLEDKIEEVDAILRQVEKDFEKTVDKKKTKEISKKDEENVTAWKNSFTKATQKFSKYLLDAEGNLNQKSELMQKTWELLSKDAKKAKFIKGLHENVNPEYDNANGIYIAMHDALDLIRESKTTKPKQKTKTNSIEKDFNDQMFSTDRQVSIGDSSGDAKFKKELAEAKQQALKHGMNSQAGIAYYKMLRSGYKSFSDKGQ